MLPGLEPFTQSFDKLRKTRPPLPSTPNAQHDQHQGAVGAITHAVDRTHTTLVGWLAGLIQTDTIPCSWLGSRPSLQGKKQCSIELIGWFTLIVLVWLVHSHFVASIRLVDSHLHHPSHWLIHTDTIADPSQVPPVAIKGKKQRSTDLIGWFTRTASIWLADSHWYHKLTNPRSRPWSQGKTTPQKQKSLHIKRYRFQAYTVLRAYLILLQNAIILQHQVPGVSTSYDAYHNTVPASCTVYKVSTIYHIKYFVRHYHIIV